MKDASAKKWAVNKLMYKVGSWMKACATCGDFEIRYTRSGRPYKFYKNGYNVFRAYKPWSLGTQFSWKCYDCGAIDLAAWSDDADGINGLMLGKEPVRGSATAKEYAKERMKEGTHDGEIDEHLVMLEWLKKRRPDGCDEKIANLERRIAVLGADPRAEPRKVERTVRMATKARLVPAQPSRAAEIKELEERLAALMARIKATVNK
jgi:hypothetical protein